MKKKSLPYSATTQLWPPESFNHSQHNFKESEFVCDLTNHIQAVQLLTIGKDNFDWLLNTYKFRLLQQCDKGATKLILFETSAWKQVIKTVILNK